MTDAAQLEQRRLAAEVADLRESVDHLMRLLLDRDDRRTGTVLLPLVFELVGLLDFDAGTLAAAALNDRTTTGQAVREILADHADDDGGFRGLGRLLQRLAGVRLAGHRLVPRGEGRGGLRWRVQVSER